MSIDAWITLAVVGLTVLALVRHWTAPSVAVLVATGSLMSLGVTTPAEAFSGFGNPAPMTVAALYVLAASIEKTGALRRLVGEAFGPTTAPRSTLKRLLWSSAGASAVLNNTPVVAMLVPQVSNWAGQRGENVARYLMPISFCAILGGMVTLIGTSTNLVVSGLLEESGRPPLGMFEMTGVALPGAVVGVLMVLWLAPRVFPGTSPEGCGGSAVAWTTRGKAPEKASPSAATVRRRHFVLGVGGAVIALAALGVLPILSGALAGAVLAVLSRVLTLREAVRAIDLNVILLIAGSFGVGQAVQVSGLAATVAGGLVMPAARWGPVAVLAVVVLCTILLTELITNNAAAVLMFPIAVAAAISLDVEPRPFAWAVALAASASFLSPVGYQTNTMVFGPGSYRFGDYARLGLPVTLTVAGLVVLLVSFRWDLV